MNSLDVFYEVKKRIFSMKDVDEVKIKLNSLFLSLNFDSLDYVEIQVFVLDCYGVRVEDELFSQQRIISIEQLVSYVMLNIRD